MKKAHFWIASVGALALVIAAGDAAAQHGGGMGGGMGMPMGGSMGHSQSFGRGEAASHGPGFSSLSNPGVSSRSSTKALSNSHTVMALTNALQKAGIALPAGGLASACGGFHNLGQCVATLHVANNLGVPFASLKTDMTGSPSLSLGKAIQKEDPNANASAAAKHANSQANTDIEFAG